MKEKVVIFVIGLLFGAIISTGSIYFYTLANNNSNNSQGMQMMNGTPPSGQFEGQPNMNNTEVNTN